MDVEIVMVSANKGKIKEVQEILNEFKIIPMNEYGYVAKYVRGNNGFGFDEIFE